MENDEKTTKIKEDKIDKDEKDELLEEYNELKLKFNLPEFEKLAEDFDIEKSEEKQTSFLLREIRRLMIEKISAYSHLLETLLNPASPPMFIFSVLKNLTDAEKQIIKESYSKLAKLQLRAIRLDTIYNEKEEAEFIVFASKEWDTIKHKAHNLFQQFETKFEESNGSKKSGYFS